MADGTKVFEGYVDDCRNTDNAWVENTVLNIHLGRKNPLLTTVKNAVAGGHEALQWRELSGKGRLTAEHRDSLRRVAEHHNSKF